MQSAAPGGSAQNIDSVGAQGATNLDGSLEGKQEIIPAFERWWKTGPNTPRKVAMYRCQEDWQKDNLDDIVEIIIAHTEWMKKSTAWRTGYEPSPKTYLTERRWLDAIPPEESELVEKDDEKAEPEWHKSASGIETQGRKLNLTKQEAETMPDYFLRVAKASGPGDWILRALRRAKDDGPTRLQHVIGYFGEDLVPADWWPMA